MTKRRDVTVTDLGKQFIDKGESLNEYMDCSIRALAIVADISYEDARELLTVGGRKYRRI